MMIKYLLFASLFSCAVTETLFGPYSKEKYCSGQTLDEMKKSKENFEMASRSSHRDLSEFLYQSQNELNSCFKKYTVSKVKSRYYCVVVKLRKREKFNKIRYIAVDNKQDGVSSDLLSCLEHKLAQVENVKLGLYIDLTFHYPLKLSR